MPKIALFNSSRTLTDMTFADALRDIEYLKSGELQTFGDTTLAENREKLSDWLYKQRPRDIQPLVELTAQQFPGRLAQWAGLVIAKEVEFGSEIGLYSKDTIQPLLEGQARGIELALPGVKISKVIGRPLKTDKLGRYVGFAKLPDKAAIFQQVTDEGYDIDLVADSRELGVVLDNVSEDCEILGVNLKNEAEMQLARAHGLPQVNWAYTHPYTRLILPDDFAAQLYDLNVVAEQQHFLEGLGYDSEPTPPAV